jgi:uncharacterized protein YcbX
MPHLAKILLYPIKSLDGVEVEQATILPSGALHYDRELAIFDAQGKFVNAKRYPKIHLLRAKFALAARLLQLKLPESDLVQVFHLDAERRELEVTLSNFFGFPVTLRQNSDMGFPDDTNSPGATVISTATLTEVAAWFPGIGVDEMRRRLRANIEIDGVPAFWEDRLFRESGEVVPFQIGDVSFFGVNPCQRCVVPTRDSNSGATDANFQKIFVQQRQVTLPAWVAASRFNHFYKLAVNTRLPASATGKILHLGSKVTLL